LLVERRDGLMLPRPKGRRARIEADMVDSVVVHNGRMEKCCGGWRPV
jgi:hypothetical protein